MNNEVKCDRSRSNDRPIWASFAFCLFLIISSSSVAASELDIDERQGSGLYEIHNKVKDELKNDDRIDQLLQSAFRGLRERGVVGELGGIGRNKIKLGKVNDQMLLELSVDVSYSKVWLEKFILMLDENFQRRNNRTKLSVLNLEMGANWNFWEAHVGRGFDSNDSCIIAFVSCSKTAICKDWFSLPNREGHAESEIDFYYKLPLRILYNENNYLTIESLDTINNLSAIRRYQPSDERSNFRVITKLISTEGREVKIRSSFRPILLAKQSKVVVIPMDIKRRINYKLEVPADIVDELDSIAVKVKIDFKPE